MRCRVVLLLALAVCAAAQQAPACDDARASCDADCAAQNLVATSFLCRDTPFGSIQSCSCGQPEVRNLPLAPHPTARWQASHTVCEPLPARLLPSGASLVRRDAWRGPRWLAFAWATWSSMP